MNHISQTDDSIEVIDEANYYLGIDGGGTKTLFVLNNKCGKEIRRLQLGASNPWDVGVDQAFQVWDRGIREVCGDISMSQISVFAGLAGGTAHGIQEKIHSFLSSYHFQRVRNGSDAHSAVKLALGDEDGMAIIMGTGFIGFIQKDGQLTRRAGYDPLVEKRGSGYAIGSYGVLAALKAEDGSGRNTLIRKLILDKAGTTTIQDIPHENRATKKGLAAFAPCVFDAYRLGDEIAEEILRSNMEEVADLIRSSTSILTKGPRKIVLVGGLMNVADILVPMLREHLKEEIDEYNVSVCQEPMVKGALLLAGMPDK